MVVEEKVVKRVDVGQAGGGEAGTGWSAGQYRLRVHECAARVMAGREERAEAGWECVCVELVGVLRLLECVLLVEGATASSEDRLSKTTWAYAREACGWEVEMPPLEEQSLTSEEEEAEEDTVARDETNRAARLAALLVAGASPLWPDMWALFGPDN